MPTLTIIPDIEGKTPEYRERECIAEIQTFKIGGLGKGMQSGDPSVSILIDLPDGRYVFVETSLRLFLSAADALKAKWGDPRYGIPPGVMP